MLAQVVLVTRLLGVVAGPQAVSVHVDPAVKSVDLVRDGTPVATLSGAPWRTVIDFGAEIAPHDLTTIARDAFGNEIARDRQLVNLARPAAEAAVVLEPAGDGRLRATAKWQHIASKSPKKIDITLDETAVPNRNGVAILPVVDPTSLHLLRVEVAFADVSARKELVFGGRFAAEVPSELTGVLVRQGDAKEPDLERCFRVDDQPLAAAAIEKPDAVVYFVRSGSPKLTQRKLGMPSVSGRDTSGSASRAFRFDQSVRLQYIWPVSQVFRGKDATYSANLFLRSAELDGRMGTHQFLTNVGGPTAKEERYADAVAVAGVQALNGGKRRVVVLILGGEVDHSRHAAPLVRRYLQRIGVPLRVWSLVPITTAMSTAWGAITDVSNTVTLRTATEELKRELDRQRIAWLPVDPLQALRVRTAPNCMSVPVANAD